MQSHVFDDKFYCCDGLRDGKWSQMVTTGYKPMGQRNHIAACCRESVVVHILEDHITDVHFADVFVINVVTNHIT